MKVKVSTKNRQRYSQEDQTIEEISTKLKDAKTIEARKLVEELVQKTTFKKKSGKLEKNFTKYIALKLSKNTGLDLQILSSFVQNLWEEEQSALREIGIFILGKIYPSNPDAFLEEVFSYAQKALRWNDLDNLVHYVLEEQVAEDYDFYLKKLQPLITQENQWLRRLAIVALGRGFFLSKKKEHVKQCFSAIEPTFTDSRKIVLDGNSWVIGTLGFRVAPEQVVHYFEKYNSSKNTTCIKLFCDAIRRTTCSKKLPADLKKKVSTTLETWQNIEEQRIVRTVESALEFLTTE